MTLDSDARLVGRKGGVATSITIENWGYDSTLSWV